MWMALFFKTFESSLAVYSRKLIYLVFADYYVEMVLFHESFVALKARCPITTGVDRDDYHLDGEKRLFKG
jgi:hypothetical protein